jgi:hypothetical protein
MEDSVKDGSIRIIQRVEDGREGKGKAGEVNSTKAYLTNYEHFYKQEIVIRRELDASRGTPCKIPTKC